MSKSKSYKEKLVDWGTLADNVASHLTDFPHLATDQKALADLVTQARGMQDQRDTTKAGLQDLNQQRRALASQATRLQNRLAAGVRNAYDVDSERLVEFGIKPVRKKVRRSASAKLESAQKAAARLAAKIAALEAAKPQIVKT